MSRGESAITELLGIMARLRSPDGCPWDREQTFASLRPYLIEEAYETLEAIDSGDPNAHRDELGDVLLQIVFQCQIASEQQTFDFADVAHAIARKLVRRHPHVFGDGSARTPAEVSAHWHKLKQAERTGSALDGVPAALPALLTAHRLGERAARVGFDWPDLRGVLAKVREELAELEQALGGPEQAIRSELGDLLFAVSQVARHLGFDAEDALREANHRFRDRFQWMEREATRRGQALTDLSADELEALWDQAKRTLEPA